ncbi:predicted protein [Streptomyces viridosporus ATCC 14672]|uniref:Predicted protein n=1 Tax=Streptomyces viridosporus (strain ATCC 14672 / DSM 40746 / JCM 4963 / KCTC 9882 / NRRL B-12104 / FH 1290) TaxID=566461 RepID=D6A3N3_STRV1|nr:predicted protein [Streptomyces viridosporus ATCC 14672]
MLVVPRGPQAPPGGLRSALPAASERGRGGSGRYGAPCPGAAVAAIAVLTVPLLDEAQRHHCREVTPGRSRLDGRTGSHSIPRRCP